MTRSLTLAVIGGGRMGEAIVSGLIAAGTVARERIAIAEVSEARRADLDAYGVRCVGDGHDIVSDTEIVLFAVKPQVIDAVVVHLAEDIPPGTIVVSIAAGISTARLEDLLPAGTAVVRVMPNTPVIVGQGMAVVSGGSAAGADEVERVRLLFEAVGEAVVLDERHQDAATAISGSGPAYAALFLDALARAGAEQGLPPDVAQALALQMLKGTAELLATTGMRPEELVDAVSSPGGTTVAAIQALEAGGFGSAVSNAVGAAVRRSKELGS